MTIDEKDAVDAVRQDVAALSALIEAVADKSDDPAIVSCLRGLETLADTTVQHLRAITA